MYAYIHRSTQIHPAGCSNHASQLGSRTNSGISSMRSKSGDHATFTHIRRTVFPLLSVEIRVSLLLRMSGNCSSSEKEKHLSQSYTAVCGETASKSLLHQPSSNSKSASFITKSSMLEAREQISLGGSLKLFIDFLLTVSVEPLTLNSLQTEIINSASACINYNPSAGFKLYAVGISVAQRLKKRLQEAGKCRYFKHNSGFNCCLW